MCLRYCNNLAWLCKFFFCSMLQENFFLLMLRRSTLIGDLGVVVMLFVMLFGVAVASGIFFKLIEGPSIIGKQILLAFV